MAHGGVHLANEVLEPDFLGLATIIGEVCLLVGEVKVHGCFAGLYAGGGIFQVDLACPVVVVVQKAEIGSVGGVNTDIHRVALPVSGRPVLHEQKAYSGLLPGDRLVGMPMHVI